MKELALWEYSRGFDKMKKHVLTELKLFED